jgi:2-polyprenyl-3-methyl-5-hydroxy-6-metoxy-1,4-benzoquinol methylase
MASGEKCPLCAAALEGRGRRYALQELFELWKPVQFSEATVRQHASQSNETRLYKCENCKFGVFLPPIIGTPEFYVEAYSLSRTREASDFTYSTSKWDFDEGLRDVIRGERILEVGSGPGHFLELAKSRGCSVVGVEFNRVAADLASSKGLEIHDSLAAALDQDHRFDRVFAFHVLEHVKDPVAFLQQLCELTKPGGTIGLSTPNQDGPVKYIDPCIQNMPPHHATRWSRSSFKALADRVGCRIQRAVREPLTPESAYYYSIYWVGSVLGGDSRWRTSLRRGLGNLLQRAFAAYFRWLALFGKHHSTLLSGQSIYVLLTVPANMRRG